MSDTFGNKIDLDTYKTILKDMLGEIHKICTENRIRYFVTYGTLIGTVRHNGFIPWDDDIDIWMEAADYQRFARILSERASEYYIISPETSPYYYNLMYRFCSKKGILKLKGIISIDNLGPFIDIFLLHKAPQDPEERNRFYQEIKRANKAVRLSLPYRYYKSLSMKRRIKMLMHISRRIKWKRAGTAKLQAKRAALVSRYDQTDSNLYFAVSERNCSDKTLLTEEILNTGILHQFEDIEVMIPPNYDEILTRIYGDYMTPPPEEERKSIHHFTPYWRA